MNSKGRLFALIALTLVFVFALSGSLMAADLTNEEKIEAAYQKARDHYLENRTINDYWDAWAAYAALGDFVQDPANGYTVDPDLLDQIDSARYEPSKQRGAFILGVIALGENPYNYQGRDLVQELIDADPGNGIWSVPVFNALALEAAGADCDNIPIDYCLDQVENLDMGPDIGGWALVAVSRHLSDEYAGRSSAAIATFNDALQERMWGNSTGSPGISMACVTLGFTALTAQGLRGYDVSCDTPWFRTDGNHDPVGVMYNNWVLEQENLGYRSQYRLAFLDLYNVLYNNGDSAWISMGVDRAKVYRQIQKARRILANSQCYTVDSINQVGSALSAVEGISSQQLNGIIADYGREYYALYDAVRNAQLSFNDTSEGQWFYPDVSYVVFQGIMNGLSNTEFGPNRNITRGQFLTILGRMAGVADSASDRPVTTRFGDVDPAAYYAAHVAWGVDLGITTGTGAATFDPAANITRQDMATMIARYAAARNITLSTPDGSLFADHENIAAYARPGVYAMKASGIISGKGDNIFDPTANATRAEAAKIIHKLMEL